MSYNEKRCDKTRVEKLKYHPYMFDYIKKKILL